MEGKFDKNDRDDIMEGGTVSQLKDTTYGNAEHSDMGALPVLMTKKDISRESPIFMKVSH